MVNRVLKVMLFSLSLAMQSLEARAADLRILVGFPPGGTVDSIARVFAEKLKASSGGAVVVDNRPGAGGLLATKMLVAAPSDGSVLLLSAVSTMAIHALVRPEDGFDPARDVAPVSLATEFQYGLAVANALEVRDLKEFVAWAHANPSKAAFGSPGAGTLPHLFGVLFARSAGIDMIHIPFKGGAPLVTDLIGGHVPAGVSPATDYIEHHRSGRLRLIATSGDRRSSATPEVPTFVEQGFKDAQAQAYFAFWAPAKSESQVVARRNREIGEVLALEDARERLVQLGQRPVASTPDEVTRLMRSEAARWAPVLKASGFTPEH